MRACRLEEALAVSRRLTGSLEEPGIAASLGQVLLGLWEVIKEIGDLEGDQVRRFKQLRYGVPINRIQ
jgi:hypothetical protein